jgi:hypothetical protein
MRLTASAVVSATRPGGQREVEEKAETTRFTKTLSLDLIKRTRDEVGVDSRLAYEKGIDGSWRRGLVRRHQAAIISSQSSPA